jgi:hypothetical protein
MPYVVMVDDNFHYMDEDERYKHCEFADAEVAIEHCRQIVDEYLASAYKEGMLSTDLWDSYVSFGEDPFILSVDVPQVRFSAWDYAKSRCRLLCSGQDSAETRPAVDPSRGATT